MAFMTREKGPLPPVILLIFISLQVVLHMNAPLAILIESPWTWSGVAIVLTGIAIIASPALAFKRSETTIVPFQESSSLVVSGMYNVTRNPMYLGMVTILTGCAVLGGSLSPFLMPVLFVPVLNRRVIRHEEIMLEEAFGDEYRNYRQRVRRWL